MASCFLIDRLVRFVDNSSVVETSSEEDDEDEEEFDDDDGIWDGCALGEVLSWEEEADAIAAYLRAMTPCPQVEPPPRVSYLSMVRPDMSNVDPKLRVGLRLDSGFIAVTHERFVVVYAGSYHPATPSIGCYLVYDAGRTSGSQLSTVPGIPYSASYGSIGIGTIIMVDPEGAFVLAELLTKFSSNPPEALLCLWYQGPQRWVYKVGRLPADVSPPKYVFSAHTSFCFDASICCWVDLFHGMLICDSELCDPEFHFIPLPDGYSIDTKNSSDRQFSAREFRAVSCVAGTIKFASLDGYLEQPVNITLTIWSLHFQNGDPSLPAKWFKVVSIPASSISFPRGMNIRYPVLSTRLHYIVYFVLTTAKTTDGRTATKTADGHQMMMHRVHSLLTLDVMHGRVLAITDYNSNGGLWPQLVATEFGSYLPSWAKDHQAPRESQPDSEAEYDAEEYHAMLLKQIEFYFSEDNLRADLFLRRKMDGQGWVDISLIAGFMKVRELTNDLQYIKETVQSSSILEMQGNKIRRQNDWDKWVIPRGSNPDIASSSASVTSHTDINDLTVHLEGVGLHE